jgi:hypothetical protein
MLFQQKKAGGPGAGNTAQVDARKMKERVALFTGYQFNL